MNYAFRTWGKSFPAWVLAVFISGCGGGGDSVTPVPVSIPAADMTSAAIPPRNTAAAANNGVPGNIDALPKDEPYASSLIYDTTIDGNTTDVSEGAAVTHHRMTLKGKVLQYTAKIGHLVARDPAKNGEAQAAISYVAFTLDGQDTQTRPVTFSFNGGPGSPSQTIMMGGFAPKRVDTNTPLPAGEAPYRFGDNAETLLDRSDLVYMDPPATGWSSAIAPKTNREFLNADADVKVDSEFVMRYLAANGRTASPVFVFGESYGGPRAAMMGYYLEHTLKQPVAGLVLFSPALNHYGDQAYPADPFFPTAALTAWYHSQALTDANSIVSAENRNKDENKFARDVIALDLSPAFSGNYAANRSIVSAVSAGKRFAGLFCDLLPSLGWFIDTPENIKACKEMPSLTAALSADELLLARLKAYAGPNALEISTGFLNVGNTTDPLDTKLLPGFILGLYDSRAKLPGALQDLVSDYLVRDPLDGDISAPYSATFFEYVRNELKYSTISDYAELSNTRTDFSNWRNTLHVDPAGNRNHTNSLPDLRQAMIDNKKMRVIAFGGYYDLVCPFYGTQMDIQGLDLPPELRGNIAFKPFAAGHMGYTDKVARPDIRANLDIFYSAVLGSTL